MKPTIHAVMLSNATKEEVAAVMALLYKLDCRRAKRGIMGGILMGFPIPQLQRIVDALSTHRPVVLPLVDVLRDYFTMPLVDDRPKNKRKKKRPLV